jgi:hypothetical protein
VCGRYVAHMSAKISVTSTKASLIFFSHPSDLSQIPGYCVVSSGINCVAYLKE